MKKSRFIFVSGKLKKGILLSEAAKRSSSLNGRAIKALTPPPLELNGCWNVGLLMARPLREDFFMGDVQKWYF